MYAQGELRRATLDGERVADPDRILKKVRHPDPHPKMWSKSWIKCQSYIMTESSKRREFMNDTDSLWSNVKLLLQAGQNPEKEWAGHRDIWKINPFLWTPSKNMIWSIVKLLRNMFLMSWAWFLMPRVYKTWLQNCLWPHLPNEFIQ